jgi:hypothetical protein
MTEKKTAAELAKSKGTNRTYVFFQKRIKENPKINAAVKAKKLSIHLGWKLAGCDIATQDYVLEAKTSKEARARFGEAQAKLYMKLVGETVELRELKKAWGECSEADRGKFLEMLGSKRIGEAMNPNQGEAVPSRKAPPDVVTYDDEGNVTVVQFKTVQDKTDH